jgi:glycosyltransferase involved in cell wall biosynthesis
MIDHKENGYVADYLDAEDLARGIYWTIAASGDEAIRDACVERVKVHYNQQQIARRYYQLYEDASKRIQTMKER